MKGEITGLHVTSVPSVVGQLSSIPLFNPHLVPGMCTVCQSRFTRCSLPTPILGNSLLGWADGAPPCLSLSMKERERSQAGGAIRATLFLWKESSISPELCWEQRTDCWELGGYCGRLNRDPQRYLCRSPWDMWVLLHILKETLQMWVK